MNSLDRYLDRVQNLPPAPTVAIQLLDLFSNPDRDIDRIVQLIRHDPSLTAAALKRCNSCAFLGAEPVVDLFVAVSRLGLNELYCIVATLIASRMMMQVPAKDIAAATRLWRHAVCTAVNSATLAERFQLAESTAFTAGLLHDVGKLILISVEGATYTGMLRSAGHFGPTLIAVEKSCLGFTHATLGARLLERWGLPENICIAVELHHQSPVAANEHQRLAATVNFANALAHQMINGSLEAPAAAAVNPEAMILLELTADDIPLVLEQIRPDSDKVEELLQTQT
jgi:putative nucleotidyltransferase with HDIG domain